MLRGSWEITVTLVVRCEFGVHGMASLNMQSLIHWFLTNGGILAVVLTVGVAVLLVCCVGCCDFPCRDKDDLFRRHV